MKTPYQEHTDLKKIQKQWHKLTGLHSREEWSAAIVRAATAAELAANFAIRAEFTARSEFDADFVNSLLRWANGQPMVQFAPFVDVAHGWNLGDNRPSVIAPFTNFPSTLASVGAGLRWNILPNDKASFEVYWGQKLHHVPRISNTIQDHGVHLGIVVNMF